MHSLQTLFDQVQALLELLRPWLLALVPVTFIIAGLVGGILVERIIVRRFQKHGTLTGWKVDWVVAKALKGLPIIWGTLAGVTATILSIPMSATREQFWLQVMLVPFILSLIILVLRLGSNLLDYFNELRGGRIVRVSLLRSLLKATILTLGLLILLQSLGISVTPVLAALGLSGLAVSLALEETLTNAFAGLYIMMSRQTRPGDYVFMKIDDNDHLEGYVADITWRSTTIQLLPTRMDNPEEPSIAIVPNSRIASDIVIIHHRPRREREIVVELHLLSVGDLDALERITVETASRAMQQVLGNIPSAPPPVVRYCSFTPTSIKLMVVMYCSRSADAGLIQHEVVKQLYERYQREGILVSISQRTTTANHDA